MNILLHICCGPCALYPLSELRKAGHSVTGFFFNHNIHPFQEYQKRLDAARTMCRSEGLDLICRDEYLLEEFLSAVAQNPAERCLYCYFSRLDATAQQAAQSGFDAFTSSLLYSRYQNHEQIRSAAERAGARHDTGFFYKDFRPGWQEGIRLSKELGLYRQQYCGCIYSEKERYLQKGALMPDFGKTLITLGLVIAAIGVVLSLAGKIPWLGRLPGDILVKKEGFSFFFPLTSCILLSALISLLLWLLRR